MVHRLLRGQLAERRQHTEGIGRQHDDVVGQAADTGRAGVGDKVDRIGGARVLGDAVVVEVELARLVHDDVLKDGAEAAGGGVDLRLGRGIEADHLGVATTLEIEHGMRAPAMLVVTDQRAAGARAGQGDNSAAAR